MALAITEVKNIQQLLIPYVGNCPVIEEVYTPLTKPRENCGSVLLSVDLLVEKADKTKENLNIIAKLCPPNERLKRMFASHITFKHEINFYIKIIPTLVRFQKESNMEEEKLLNMFPKYLNARITLDPTSNEVNDDACILLENLRMQEYKSVSGMIGLNLQEAEIVIRNLAKFHAVPLAYKIKYPENFKQEILPFLNLVQIGEEISDEIFIDIILSHLNLNEIETNRFIKGMHKGIEFQKYFPSGNENFATMVHCDFWINNTMIKFLDNKPVHSKMIDFQTVTYGAPATDIVFFLYTSVKQDILDQYYNHLLHVYYTEFVNCLKDFQCATSNYTYDTFEKEINIYGPLQVSHILIMHEAVFSDSENTKNIDKLHDDIITVDGITDVYKLRLNYTVKKLFEKNWF